MVIMGLTGLLDSHVLSLILQDNSFQFNGKDYLQTHGTAMGTKMAVAFANIFIAKIEKEIIRQSNNKPLVWKRFIDDVFSLWNISVDKIEEFIDMRQTASIKQSSLRLRFQKKKLHSWTRKCTKVTDFTRNLSFTCKHITNPLRPFNTRISIRVIHQAFRKVLSKGTL